jgi:catechol 2,3-dioxygenase-like lactoylglutathione lyase family enzyme
MDHASVRYIVADVDAAIAFYTELLGFRLDLHPAPGFAQVSRGALRLLLNRPGAGGAGQAMPDGRLPAPGGWNRIRIEVEDLPDTVARLKAAGGQFRNEVVSGNGGQQILLEDPSGNPVELFQPA